MKFPAENPWNGAAEKFAIGNVVKRKSCKNDRLRRIC